MAIIVSEDFEGTGTPSAAWFNGSSDFDYSTNPIAGTQSLKCDGVGATRYVQYDSGIDYTEAWFKFRMRLDAMPSTFVTPLWVRDLDFNSQQIFGIFSDGRASIDSINFLPVGSIVVGVNYYVWVRYKVGSPGIVEVWINTEDDREGSLLYLSELDTNYTHEAARFLLQAQNSGVLVFDDVQFADTDEFEGGTAATGLLEKLYAYWPLDEASGNRAPAHGGSSLVDVNTVSALPGKWGAAASFIYNASEYFTLTNRPQIQLGTDTPFTIAFWFKRNPTENEIGRSYCTLFCKGPVDPNDNNNAYRLTAVGALGYGFDSRHVQFLVGNGSARAGVSVQLPIDTNWHLMVCWHDPVADTINIRIDNNSVSSTAWSGGTVIETNTLHIGRLPGWDVNSFDGSIDEFAFWKRTLTDAERDSLYYSGRGKPFDLINEDEIPITYGLVSHWNMNETSGSRLDSHGTNHLIDNNGVTSVTGKLDNAADVTNPKYLSAEDASSNLSVTGSFSFVLWFNATSFGANRPVINKDDGSSNREYYINYIGGTQVFRFFVARSGGNNFVDTPAFTSTGTWHCLMAWFDGAAETINICIDNGTVYSATKNTLAIDAAAPLWIGKSPSGVFDGYVDSVSFWKRALTPEERATLWNNGDARDYPFLDAAIEHELEAGVTGSSSAAASLSVQQELSSGVSASAELSATLSVSQAVASAVTAAAEITASLSVTRNLSADIAGTGDVGASASVSRGLSAASEGVTDLSASLEVSRGVASSVSGEASVTASLSSNAAVSATIEGSGDVVATAQVTRNLAASTAGESALSAELSISTGSLLASATGQASVSASLAITRNLAAAAQGEANLTSNATVNVSLSASVAGSANITAAAVRAAGLSASTSGQADVSASGSVSRGLGAAVAAEGSVAGSASVSRGLTSGASGAADLTSTLGVNFSVSASVAGSGNLEASLIRSHGLTATVSGRGSVEPDLTLQGAGVLICSTTGTAALQANLTLDAALESSTATQAELSANLGVRRPLVVTVSGEASAGADLSPIRGLESNVEGFASLQASAMRLVGLTATSSGIAELTSDLVGNFFLVPGPIEGTGLVVSNLSVVITPGVITFEQLDVLLDRGSWKFTYKDLDPTKPRMDEVVYPGDGLDDIDSLINRMLSTSKCNVRLSVDPHINRHTDKWVPVSVKDVFNLRTRLIERFGPTRKITRFHLSGELRG